MLKEKIFCIVAEFWQIIVYCDCLFGQNLIMTQVLY